MGMGRGRGVAVVADNDCEVDCCGSDGLHGLLHLWTKGDVGILIL